MSGIFADWVESHETQHNYYQMKFLFKRARQAAPLLKGNNPDDLPKGQAPWAE
jgi:hypothetical protein